MSTKEPIEVVLAFMDHISARDVDGLCALMTEDHVLIDGLGNRVQGRESLRKAWTAYFSWFPDYQVSPSEIFSHRETVAVFGSAEGTYAVNGKLPAENYWSVPAAWKAVVRNGLVSEWHVYADNQPARKIMGWPSP